MPGPNIGHSCFCGANDAVIVKSNCPNQIPKVYIQCTSRVKAMICILNLLSLLLVVVVVIGAALAKLQSDWARGWTSKESGFDFWRADRVWVPSSHFSKAYRIKWLGSEADHPSSAEIKN